MPFRVGVAGFLHESNSFASPRTSYESFAATCMVRGDAFQELWGPAAHELGGMLAGCREENLEALPLYSTFAVPSGEIEAEAYERIAAELLAEIRAAGPLDGLLLALHGATVSEAYPDADGEMLRRVRDVVGPDLPLILTFDLHANLSRAMIRHSHAAIGYTTNPHLDQRDRGVEAARLLARMLRGEARPVQHIEMPPMVLRNSAQHTGSEPAKSLYDDMREVRSWPGILSASVAMGFLHADVEEVGASFVAVADGDEELARKAARWMAGRAWDRREAFTRGLPGASEAVSRAASAPAGPVTLMDTGDNVGGGSAADSTVLLEEMLRQGVTNGLVVLRDPDAVAACVAAGVRSEVALEVGGKTDALHGRRVAIRGRVRTLSDGVFEETQVRHGGWRINDQGVTAVVETPDQHTIVLTTRRMAPFSLEQLISLGIHPERKRILVAKGVVAPRAAYEPVSKEIILVDTPGATADDPARLPYQRRRRPLYPLEPDASYSPPNP